MAPRDDSGEGSLKGNELQGKMSIQGFLRGDKKRKLLMVRLRRRMMQLLRRRMKLRKREREEKEG